MNKNIRYFVSRSNPMTLLMVLCMFASAAVRIVFSIMRGIGDAGYFWALVALPACACVLFGIICLVNGQERYYQTAIPVYMMALYFCFYTQKLVPGINSWTSYLVFFMYFTLATLYALAVDGKFVHFWGLTLVYLVPLLFRTADNWQDLSANFILRSTYELLPDALFYLGLILGLFATRIQSDGKYHPTWGDRSDGRRLRSLDPMNQIIPYIMVERNAANNFFTDAFEITAAERYIRQKRHEGLLNFGLNHLILAAYVRCIAKYPELNRFIAGQKIYSHGEDIQVSMVIKKEMTIEGSESTIKVHLSPKDTAADVYQKFHREVKQVKDSPLNSTFDNTARLFTLIPGLFLKLAVWFLKLLDYFGLLPKAFLEISPFHGSLFVTSMGSLGIPSIFHHLYDFGNLPVFVSFSRKRHVNEITDEGVVVQRKYLDLNITMDERICDGFAYASALKYLKRIMRHPEVLDFPPESVKQDVI